jgi:tRNA threonylcarbamoyladenosine biosynthesis protein TsaB
MQKGGAIHMKRLMFDVSTNVMYVAYVREQDVRDFSIRIAKRDHAKYLVDRIDQLLKRNRISLDQIDEIIVGIGPGSYTGIRIAVMVAKMLAYTKNIPLKTISSLLFMTSGYKTKVAAMLDARRGNVFCAVYDQGKTIIEDGLRTMTAFNQMSPYVDAESVFIDEMSYEVDASVIIAHAKIVEDIHALVPNYLRKTEAETNYDQKNE